MPFMMSTVLRTALQSALAALVLACTPLAHADVSADGAAAVAVQTHGGRVLSVDRVGGQRPAWRVKLVTARGEVRIVMIDSATGRPL